MSHTHSMQSVGLWAWRGLTSSLPFQKPSDHSVSNTTPDFSLGGSSAVVMSKYHICKYDPILGVLVLVGNDTNAMVVGKDMCHVKIPLKHGVHCLQCFIYAGTTTFLILSPDALLCLDYSFHGGDSLLPCGSSEASFTCLHVPQGLTWGAVGRKDGTVSYFGLCPTASEGNHSQLAWASTEVNLLQLCQPYCKEEAESPGPHTKTPSAFFTTGSVLAMDSDPGNPNAFIGVLAGIPGVCKWYVAERRLSCFFCATSVSGLPDRLLATCKVTPGGMYVAAVTMHCTRILLWHEKKKRKDKVAELYWSIDLGASMTREPKDASYLEAFMFHEYTVGLHMARMGRDGTKTKTPTDQQGQLIILLHGPCGMSEVIVRLESKQVIKHIQLSPHFPTDGSVMEYPEPSLDVEQVASTEGNPFDSIFHVEPCVLSNYWKSAWRDVDLEVLVVTSTNGFSPMLIKRSRHTRGIEDVQLLQLLGELPLWHARSVLLRLSGAHLHDLAMRSQKTCPVSLKDKLLSGGDSLLSCCAATNGEWSSGNVSQLLCQDTILLTVPGVPQAVLLSPQSNEICCVHSTAFQECELWSSLSLCEDSVGLILEQPLPTPSLLPAPTELILRVFASHSHVTVTRVDLRYQSSTQVAVWSRESFRLEGDGLPGQCMVRHAAIVDARLEKSEAWDSSVAVSSDGKSVLLLLENSTVVLADLSGAVDDSGRPLALTLSTLLFPSGSTVISLDTFWMESPGADRAGTLCVACLLGGGYGFLLWDFSTMRLLAYCKDSFISDVSCVKAVSSHYASSTNLSGDVTTFEVVLHRTEIIGPPVCGVVGTITCCDAIGTSLFVCLVGYRILDDHPGNWCYRSSTMNEWGLLDWIATSTSLCCRFTIHSNGTLSWTLCADGEAVLVESTAKLSGGVAHVRGRWECGKAELIYTTPENEVRNYVLNNTLSNAGSSSKAGKSPTVIFSGPREIVAVDVNAMIHSHSPSTGTAASPQAAVRVESTRWVEDTFSYEDGGVFIVITRDVNGWRWLNVLDNHTLQPRMQAHSIVDLAREDHLRVLAFPQSNSLHLYVIGSSCSTLGHYLIESDLGTVTCNNFRERHPFRSEESFQPCPPTYRAYGRLLPPHPTTKQETGFLKRLLTAPWEDVALWMESEVILPNKGKPSLQAHEPSAVIRLCGESSSPLPCSHTHADPHNIPLSKAEQSPLTAAASDTLKQPAGSRYAEVKALATNYNVSITEAQRMMNKNMQRVQQRGERLHELQNRSEELSHQAHTFEELARKLKEKKRDSWF